MSALAGRFHFDRIWKDLFLERILDSRYLKHFLNDVSDQEANLLRSQKLDSRGKSRFILDELYQNLDRLEQEVNMDYIMPDFATYVALDDCDETADPG